ncbi:MAG TPA: glycosyltransferase [Luteibacter sp.]|jgi:hypothetical protein|nr:glycosyltransferase [Luteibacter sp.]
MKPNTKPSRVQIIGRDNGAGLTCDLELLADALRRAGAEVTVKGLPHRGRFAAWLTTQYLRFAKPAFDVNIMIERIRAEFAGAARINVLVPNPEWFDAASAGHEDVIARVWVKTHHAIKPFESHGLPASFIGFTSTDRRLPDVPKERSFFHGPGRSGAKGTLALLALWAKHPEWPRLTIVWRRKRVDLGTIPANVTVMRERLDEATYRRLQNTYTFHLCPSQTEGWGHYIAEAMSVGAVVVTVDAEPMNELVSPDRGVLVDARPAGTQHLATLYDFDEASMRQGIERCIAMSDEECARLSGAARAWYETNHAEFPQRVAAALAATVETAA